MTNTRFSTAVHLLTELANVPGERLSSAQLAERLDSHAVVVRRLVQVLKKAGLVQSAKGTKGGVFLAVDPKEIMLSQIADVVEEKLAYETHALSPSASIQNSFSDAILTTIEAQQRKVETAAIAVLDGITLKDVLDASVLRFELAELVASGLSDNEIREGYRIVDGHLVRK